MKIADYMHLHGLTPKTLRKKLGIKGNSTVQRYISGERVPSRGMLNRIETITNGLVTGEDFHDPAPPLCERIVVDRLGNTQRVYPWTNLEKDWQWHMDEEPLLDDPLTTLPPPTSDADDHGGPSKPVQLALDMLGARVLPAKRGGFLLDGRLVDTAKLVKKANELREQHGLAPIPYPGVHPIPEGAE